jgi:hypothetical protein
MKTNSSVSISFPGGTSNPGDPVEVDVQTKFNWLSYFGNVLGFTQTTMTGKAVMRLEQKPTNYASNSASSC